MAKIETNNATAQPAQATVQKPSVLWPTIGKAWINTDKKGRPLISIVIGNRRENLGSVTLNEGDKLALRPNQQRPGRKDANYQVCLVI